MAKVPARAVLAMRLKELRKAMGVSQAELGVRMGLPEDVASTRVNRYEKGVHAPDIDTAERMAAELGVPLAYLLTKDERLAEMIRGFAELPIEDQDRILGEVGKALRKQAGTKGEKPTRRAASKARPRQRPA